MKWELIEDGYHREQRLVEPCSGLIIGGTRGSVHQNEGWFAHTDGIEGRKNIGKYVTEDLAKKAVENAQPSPKDK